MNPPFLRSLPPNSQNSFLLPTTDSILYLKTTRNYIAWSMLSSLSTSQTTVLRKFESNKNNLPTASFSSPLIRDFNNKKKISGTKSMLMKVSIPTNISSLFLFMEFLRIPSIPSTRSFTCATICGPQQHMERTE